MAPKRLANRQPTPIPAAFSDETDSRSRSDESEDEETIAVSLTPASKKSPPAPPQNGEESETFEDDDDDDDMEVVESTRAAPPSAPKHPPPRQGEESDTDDEEEEEGDSESNEVAPPTRPAPVHKAKGLKPPSSRDAKKPSRIIWSAADEVRILEALAAHHRNHGELPQPDALVAALAGSLDNRSFGSKELQRKVKALKARCVNLAKKNEIPSKEHERRLLDISKTIWAGGRAADAITMKATGQAPREFDDMCDMYPFLAEEVKLLDVTHPGLFKRPFGMIDDDKARALDLKIKKQRVVQVRAEQRRRDLSNEVINALLGLIQ